MTLSHGVITTIHYCHYLQHILEPTTFSMTLLMVSSPSSTTAITSSISQSSPHIQQPYHQPPCYWHIVDPNLDDPYAIKIILLLLFTYRPAPPLPTTNHCDSLSTTPPMPSLQSANYIQTSCFLLNRICSYLSNCLTQRGHFPRSKEK